MRNHRVVGEKLPARHRDGDLLPMRGRHDSGGSDVEQARKRR